LASRRKCRQNRLKLYKIVMPAAEPEGVRQIAVGLGRSSSSRSGRIVENQERTVMAATTCVGIVGKMDDTTSASDIGGRAQRGLAASSRRAAPASNLNSEIAAMLRAKPTGSRPSATQMQRWAPITRTPISAPAVRNTSTKVPEAAAPSPASASFHGAVDGPHTETYTHMGARRAVGRGPYQEVAVFANLGDGTIPFRQFRDPPGRFLRATSPTDLYTMLTAMTGGQHSTRVVAGKALHCTRRASRDQSGLGKSRRLSPMKSRRVRPASREPTPS